MTLLAVLLFYLACGSALAVSLMHPWPGSSLLTMLTLLAIFNSGNMLAEGLDDVLRFWPRHGTRSFWEDSGAPPEWRDLLKARDLAAARYRRQYMPPIPEILRLALEWGMWVAGGAGLLVLTFRIGVYPYERPSASAARTVGWLTFAVVIAMGTLYGVWAIADLVGRGARARRERPRGVIGEALPPPNPSADDRTLAEVIDLLVPPQAAHGPFTGFDGMGYKLFASCPAYTGPTTRPVRMLRDVFARFGWIWLVAGAALLLGLWVPRDLAPHWAPHILRTLAWSIAAAYAYFLYLVVQSLRIRHQAMRPWKYSPGEFAPLWRLVDEASALRDRGLVTPCGSAAPWAKPTGATSNHP